MFKENAEQRNDISFKKDSEKIVLLRVKGLLRVINYCQGLEKKIMHINIIHQPSLLRGKKYHTPK